MHYQLKTKIHTSRWYNVIPNTETLGKVLVITSKSLVEIHGIRNHFQSESCQVISSVEPELPISYIKEFYNKIRFIPDTIIAIGGGSVLDLGKVMSVCKDFKTLKSLFDKEISNFDKHAYLYSIPTTFGSGAETSFGAIIFDDEKQIKDGIRNPKIQSDEVIIDTKLYLSAPERLMAESGFDCLTHSVETYLSKKSNDIVKYHSINAIKTVFNELENAVLYKNENAVLKMALTSMMMGVNLCYSSTCLPHRVQYIIGPLTGTSHSQGLVMLWRGWLKLIFEQNSDRIEITKLLEDLRLSSSDFEGKIMELLKKLNLNYCLSDYEITECDTVKISEIIEGDLSNDPFFKDRNSIVFLLKKALKL
jgi:alcohol dehydrogenase class IV